VVAAAGCIAGCGGTAKSVPTRTLVDSMTRVLITKYDVPRTVSVQCSASSIRADQVVNCTAVASAGRGYRVRATLPCWSATFSGEVIEGPGFAPPGRGRRGRSPVAPDNLPDRFSGCMQ
jgi:hypothetical protein